MITFLCLSWVIIDFNCSQLDIWTLLTLTKEDLDGMGIINPESQALILKRIQILKNTQL